MPGRRCQGRGRRRAAALHRRLGTEHAGQAEAGDEATGPHKRPTTDDLEVSHSGEIMAVAVVPASALRLAGFLLSWVQRTAMRAEPSLSAH